MPMSDKDRFRLQELMEKDPDAAFAFHAQRTAMITASAPAASPRLCGELADRLVRRDGIALADTTSEIVAAIDRDGYRRATLDDWDSPKFLFVRE